MLHRLIVLLFVLSIVGVGVAPVLGYESTPTTPAVSAQSEAPLRIAIMTNAGGRLDDGGFNQSAVEAAERAVEEFDAEYTALEPLDASDYDDHFEEFVAEGYDLIITVGFDPELSAATIEAAQTYPDTSFIGVDQFQGEALPNLTGLIFPEDKSGFLAGVLAASLTQSNVVGGVYGTDIIPPVVAFREGYESGVRWAADELQKEITVVGEYHPGDPGVAFADPEWGRNTANFMLDVDGADVIFAAAGGTGVGALEETALFTSENDPRYCIGVDSDQWLTVESAHPCLVTSAAKLITDSLLDLFRVYLSEGDLPDGNYFGRVGLTPYHDFEDMISPETRALLARAENGLRTNAILTCYQTDFTDLRIAMVTDVGVVDDGGFNESTWNGILAAARCGAEVDYIETGNPSEYAANIEGFADDGYDIIVVVGFALQDATVAAAAAYPDIQFIGVDHFYAEPVEGVTALVFNEDQAGFLAGVLAARLTETNVVANVLGTNLIPPVVAFAEGFKAGVAYIDPEIRVISTYHPGSVAEAFTDPQWGAVTARQALDQDADVVFAAAGQTGNGALIEVGSAASGGNPPYCIGVDTDQWLTVPEAHDCLVTSAIKYLDGGTATMIVETWRGTLEAGNFYWLVGLAPYHDFEDAVPAEVKAELATIADLLATGQLETGFGQ